MISDAYGCASATGCPCPEISVGEVLGKCGVVGDRVCRVQGAGAEIRVPRPPLIALSL